MARNPGLLSACSGLPVSQGRDLGLNAANGDSRFRFGWALEGKNPQAKTLAFELQDFIPDEGFRQARKHFHDVAYLFRLRDRHPTGSTTLARAGADSGSASLNSRERCSSARSANR